MSVTAHTKRGTRQFGRLWLWAFQPTEDWTHDYLRVRRANRRLREAWCAGRIDAEIFAGPEDHTVDYFTVFIEREARESPQGFAEAYDADGDLIGRDKLCEEFVTGSTCG